MQWRTITNVLAGIVFFGVLIAGVSVVGLDRGFEHPQTTTVLTKSAPPVETSEAVVSEGRKVKKTTTTTNRTAGPSRETTSVGGGASFFERLVGDNVVYLRLALLLLAAFIAAAAVQRVLLGRYGGIKLGTLELSEIAGASEETVEKLQSAITTLQADTAKSVKALESDLKKAKARLAGTKRADAKLNENLALVVARLSAVEKKMEAGDGP